jgi:uncharacterized membrane protein
MKWKGKIEAIVVFVAAFASFKLVIQPVLASFFPILTHEMPALAALVLTVIIFSIIYDMAINHIRGNEHWYLFFDDY